MKDRIEELWSQAKIEECEEIDILGLSLRHEFFHHSSQFSDWLLRFLRSNHKAKVRILLMDPGAADLLAYRELAERNSKSGTHLRASCLEALETLHDICCDIWMEQQKRRPEVVLVTEIMVQQWLFRIDGVMIVSPYLQHKTGRYGPAFELRRGSRWFEIFQEQFERCLRLHQHNLFPNEAELRAAASARSSNVSKTM